MRYAALIAVALLLAGCGGTAGVSGSGASLVPSSTVAFAAVNTHLSETQWTAADALLARFPVQDPILAQLKSLPLGGEVDVAALGTELVVLAQKNARLSGFASKSVHGWTAYARNAAVLASLGGRTSLADVATFKTATASLQGHPLASAYARGDGAEGLIGRLPSQEQVTRIPHVGIGITRHRPSNATLPEQYVWAAAGVVADGHGTRLEARAHVLAPSLTKLANAAFMQVPIPPYPLRLPDEIPADALAVADFQIAPGEFEEIDPSQFPGELRGLAATDPSLPAQLDLVLGGETAVYVESTKPLVATLVTHPLDTKAALENLAALEPVLHLKLHTAILGGELVVSISTRAIARFSGPGPRLSGDPAFARTLKAAGVPQATTGLVYGSGAALDALARMLGIGVPSGQSHALLVYAERVGPSATTVLFLQDR